MSAPVMNRNCKNVDWQIATGTDNTIEFEAAGFAYGSIYISSNSLAATIVVSGKNHEDDVFEELVDSEGNDVQITVSTGKVFQLPDAVFSCKYIKFASTVNEVLTPINRIFLQS